MNPSACQFGHRSHKKITVKTILGDMLVYDWELYKDQPGGYCTGQDDVSRTLANIGIWESAITDRVRQMLTASDNKKGMVIDIGCNVGWYSKLASQFGYLVLSIDGNQEHLEVTKKNAPEAEVVEFWFSSELFDTETKPKIQLFNPESIKLIKIDIEGNEQFAVNYFKPYLSITDNIIMEVSPIFNNSYPNLIKVLVHEGFKVREINGTPFDFDYTFDQKDLWFCRK